MATFIDIPSEEEETFVNLPEKETSLPEGLQPQAVEFYSAALKKSKEEVAVDISGGMLPLLEDEATQKATELAENQAQERIEAILSEQPEDAQEQLNIVRENLVLGDFVAPDVAALMGEGDLPAAERRVLERSFAVQRMIEAKRLESSTGAVAKSAYFLDSAFSDMIHSPAGLIAEAVGVGEETFEGAGQLQELAQEAANLLFMDISKEEFETRFEEIIDRVANAGMFS